MNDSRPDTYAHIATVRGEEFQRLLRNTASDLGWL